MALRAIRQARIAGRDGLWDIEIERGLISALRSVQPEPRASRTQAAPDLTTTSEQVSVAATDAHTFEANGRLVSAPFVEPHVHLDAALTAGQPAWNNSGTLFEGIQRWSERKRSLTHDDVKTRAKRALLWQASHGIQHVRTHCDVTDPGLVALRALLELKSELAPWIDVQIVAFPQEGIQSFAGGAELMEEAIKLGADVVGAIPHFEFTREFGVASVKTAFDLAERYDRLIDIHCDEIDDEQSRFVEVVAAEAAQRQMGARVTASHTTAMGSYNDAYASKLFRVLRIADISFVANPLVNIHLQGRFDTYPKRRGLTRVKELLQAGLNVCFGHDDLVDPWYPMGTGNLLQVLHMGLHVCQLMGYADLSNSLRLVTTHGARALGLGAGYGIEIGRPANLMLLDATSEYDAVRRQSCVAYSIRAGEVIAETRPAQTQLHLAGARVAVDYAHEPAEGG